MSDKLKDAIWVEKHRPPDLNAVVLSEEYRELFEQFIEEDHIPHLLFYGGVGSGKTTVGQILCNKIAAVTLELNSSDDRTVTIVREKVKPFVYHSAGGMKIVFMDECDGMLVPAQRALLRLIEKGVGNARFILTANSINRVIPGLRSRCNCLKFEPPDEEYVCEWLEGILDEEEVEYDEDDVIAIVETSYPDIRQCVNTMQLNCRKGVLNYTLKQDGGAVVYSELIVLSKKKKVIKLRELILKSAISYDVAYNEVLTAVLIDKSFDKVHAEAAIVVAEYAYRDGIVVDRELNFTAMFAELGGLV